MDIFALIGTAAQQATVSQAAESGPTFQINFFWVIVSAANFIVFFLIVRWLAFGGLMKTLDDRRARIEEGLKDAEQARRDRDAAEQERLAAINEARREANDIIARAQKASTDAREADMAATREELSRLRERAAAEIEAEKQKAIAELRGEVADLALAAASRVVADSMTGDRQRKLVVDFLADSAGGSRN